MARISGVDIPREKRLVISLTYIFGIGNSTAKRICADTGLNESTRVRDLTEDEIDRKLKEKLAKFTNVSDAEPIDVEAKEAPDERAPDA